MHFFICIQLNFDCTNFIQRCRIGALSENAPIIDASNNPAYPCAMVDATLHAWIIVHQYDVYAVQLACSSAWQSSSCSPLYCTLVVCTILLCLVNLLNGPIASDYYVSCPYILMYWAQNFTVCKKLFTSDWSLCSGDCLMGSD